MAARDARTGPLIHLSLKLVWQSVPWEKIRVWNLRRRKELNISYNAKTQFYTEKDGRGTGSPDHLASETKPRIKQNSKLEEHSFNLLVL